MTMKSTLYLNFPSVSFLLNYILELTYKISGKYLCFLIY